MSDWAHPDFSDPRFGVEWVEAAATCRHEGCDQLAEHLVGYWMRRDGWTYDYECGYCDEHMPTEIRPDRAIADSPARPADTSSTPSPTLSEALPPQGGPHAGSASLRAGKETRE